MPWNRPVIGERTVAILGAGVLGTNQSPLKKKKKKKKTKSSPLISFIGRRIACVWAAGGYNVAIRDPSEEQRISAVNFVQSNIASFYKTLGNSNTKLGQYAAYEKIESAVKDSWFVVEAIPEKLDLKISTFAELADKAPMDCILGSNSSSFKSRLMTANMKNEDKKRVLNVHYTMPPVRVTEFMTSTFTDPAIFPFLEDKHRDVGLLPATARTESTG